MSVKTIVKFKEQSTDSPKTRYFKTPYETTIHSKMALHINTLGNFPTRGWVENMINSSNTNPIMFIGKTIEITESEMAMLRLNPNTNQSN